MLTTWHTYEQHGNVHFLLILYIKRTPLPVFEKMSEKTRVFDATVCEIATFGQRKSFEAMQVTVTVE